MSLRVEATGPLLLVQDRGRPGSAHLGVPPSGALDAQALALANRLVGNAEGDAGLEILLGGVRLVAQRSMRVALTGAPMPLTLSGRAMPLGSSVSVRKGEWVAVDATSEGLRSWLAVSGGIAVPPVLGSRSTDTLTGLGPPTVAAGDQLPLGEQPPHATAADGIPAALSADGVIWLGLRFGPRDDWFTSPSLERLLTAEYVVSAASNRTGVRLDGGQVGALDRALTAELPSEGIVSGAVQVPPNGQPLIFLADHPVTGGYPVVGVVDAAGLARCAQLRPGDTLRFTTSAASPRPARSRRR